jgi:hypothetical protein
MPSIIKCGACGAVVTQQGTHCNYCGAALFSLEEKKPELMAPESIDQQVLAICKKGSFLEAVKFYKDHSGKGLKESKDYVEELAKRNGIEKPAGCFVATACYGDYNAPEVLVLRHYRDTHLAKRAWGRIFIRTYYACSPPVAKLISGSAPLKGFIRKRFIAPLVRRVQKKHL